MNRAPVKSSQIAAIGYAPATSTLEIEFLPFKKTPDKPGSVYAYRNVPPQIHSELMQAESQGSFFIKAIKPFPDRYPFTKLS